MKRSLTKQRRVAKQALQIATLAPAVASARIGRIAGTGDYQALARMGAEKAATFSSSMMGMMMASNAAFAKSALAIAHAWSPFAGTPRQRMERLGNVWMSASADIANGALTPVRQRVQANSKRLGR